jgi:hypothetical protein
LNKKKKVKEESNEPQTSKNVESINKTTLKTSLINQIKLKKEHVEEIALKMIQISKCIFSN